MPPHGQSIIQVDTSIEKYNQLQSTNSSNENSSIATKPMSMSIPQPYQECDSFGLSHCTFDLWRAWLLAGVSALVAASNAKTTILLLCVRVRDRHVQRIGRTGSGTVIAKASSVHTADLFCLKLTCVNALFGAFHLCMTYCSFPFTKWNVTQVI